MARFAGVISLRIGGCTVNRRVLHQFSIRKDLCPRSLVLFSRRLLDQINARLSCTVVIDCCSYCNSPAELLEGDLIFGHPASLLLTSGNKRRDEHRSAPHPAGLCLPLGAHWRCSLGVDSTES